MKPLSPEMFNRITPVAKREICKQTMEQVYHAEKRPHSYQTICAEGRSLAIATRLSGTQLLDEFRLVNDEIQKTGGKRIYTSEQLVKAYVSDAIDITYYPLNGVIKENVEQLILFARPTPIDVFRPYARFKVGEPIKTRSINILQASHFSDLTVIMNTNFQTLLPISCPETGDLPTDYLSTYSGESIYDRSFKGGSQIIFVI